MCPAIDVSQSPDIDLLMRNAKLTIKGSGYVNTDLIESDGYVALSVSKYSTYITSCAFHLQIAIS